VNRSGGSTARDGAGNRFGAANELGFVGRPVQLEIVSAFYAVRDDVKFVRLEPGRPGYDRERNTSRQDGRRQKSIVRPTPEMVCREG
jgi:hypothetical protein